MNDSIMNLWYPRLVMRLSKDNEKILFGNWKRCTWKLEREKSHLMFNEECYNNEYNWYNVFGTL